MRARLIAEVLRLRPDYPMHPAFGPFCESCAPATGGITKASAIAFARVCTRSRLLSASFPDAAFWSKAIRPTHMTAPLWMEQPIHPRDHSGVAQPYRHEKISAWPISFGDFHELAVARLMAACRIPTTAALEPSRFPRSR